MPGQGRFASIPPNLASREPGKCSLPMCPGSRNGKTDKQHSLYLSIKELLAVNTVAAQDRGPGLGCPVGTLFCVPATVLVSLHQFPKVSSTQSLPLLSFQGESHSYLSAPTASPHSSPIPLRWIFPKCWDFSVSQLNEAMDPHPRRL